MAAIQLALQVGGADKVFTTCGTDDKVKFLQKLGDNIDKLHVFNYRTQSGYTALSEIGLSAYG